MLRHVVLPFVVIFRITVSTSIFNDHFNSNMNKLVLPMLNFFLFLFPIVPDLLGIPIDVISNVAMKFSPGISRRESLLVIV